MPPAYLPTLQRVPPERSTSRYFSWQAAQASLSVSLTSSIASRFFVCAALWAFSPATTSPFTAFVQSGCATGAGRPFEQRRIVTTPAPAGASAVPRRFFALQPVADALTGVQGGIARNSSHHSPKISRHPSRRVALFQKIRRHSVMSSQWCSGQPIARNALSDHGDKPRYCVFMFRRLSWPSEPSEPC